MHIHHIYLLRTVVAHLLQQWHHFVWQMASLMAFKKSLPVLDAWKSSTKVFLSVYSDILHCLHLPFFKNNYQTFLLHDLHIFGLREMTVFNRISLQWKVTEILLFCWYINGSDPFSPMINVKSKLPYGSAKLIIVVDAQYGTCRLECGIRT